jgi:integrase
VPEEHEFRVTKKKSNGEVTYRWLSHDPVGSLGQVFKRRLPLGRGKYVFGTPAGSLVNKDRFQDVWTNVRLAASGVELKKGPHGVLTSSQQLALRDMDLHFHDRRHLTAKRIYRETADIYFVSLLLGHSSVKTTQRCLQISEEEFRDRMREYERAKREGALVRPRLRLVAGGEA